MAGFYVHIPFCRQACRYCDFHFSVSVKYIPDMIDAMLKEIRLKKELFGEFGFDSLYFGGGTPSLLKVDELNTLLESIFKHYKFNQGFEFTLEANTDDITAGYVRGLKEAGVNRLSIGIQSFYEKDLVLMRRSHSSKQAVNALKISREAGIENINADMIYGIPGLSSAEWEKNLDRIFEMDVQHISAYHLTFEPGTVFDHWRKKGRIIPVTDEESLEQLKILKSITRERGFIHYEISNFGKENFFSRHNLVYWNLLPYAGIGPSAHSYDGNCRFWNRSDNRKYMDLLGRMGNNYYEYEELSQADHYNEYLLTSLRTMWGADLKEIERRFGEHYVKYTESILKDQINSGWCQRQGQKFRLSKEGIFLADKVIRDFIKI
ncbi:MAG: radical SAM family heme chaperone HemW [Bacteroidales bacterium]|nr:radical SAM family heme chaperone HemW [Bacteroidales bacterium]